jgi:hypothetical protein
LASLREPGGLRRVAAILFHRRAGFSANGMGVWEVPEPRLLAIGRRMDAFRGSRTATSADLSPTGRIPCSHGPRAPRRRSATPSLDSIAEATGIEERATLYSSTEFKKVRMLYFTDDFRRWEEEHS